MIARFCRWARHIAGRKRDHDGVVTGQHEVDDEIAINAERNCIEKMSMVAPALAFAGLPPLCGGHATMNIRFS